MNDKTDVTLRALLILAMLAAAILACNFNSGQKTPDVSVTELVQSLSRTQTAEANEESSTNDLATAQAKATALSLEIGATQTAMAAQQDVNQLATATIAAPILAELPIYQIDPNKGHAAWLHKPVSIELQGKNQFGYANDYMQTIVKDFVLAADITWDTQYGSSGCGFMFRSNGDQKKPDQYLVIATRLASGHVIFTAVAQGQLANARDFFPKSEDRTFSAVNGSTNRLAVVGQGNILQIYVNESKIGEVDTTQPPKQSIAPPAPQMPTNQTDVKEMDKYKKLLGEYQDMLSQMKSNYTTALTNSKNTPAVFTEGLLAMIAVSESGHTLCKFDNAWLWVIDQ